MMIRTIDHGIRIAVGGLLLCALLAGSSRAESYLEDPLIPSHWYIGLGAIYAVENLDYGVEFGNSAGVNATVGVRFASHFALELNYQWIEGFDTRGTFPSQEVESHLATFNTRLYPLERGPLQPFVVVGLGALFVDAETVPFDSDSMDVGFASLFGGGIEYYVGELWILGMESNYILPTGNVKHNDYATILWTFKVRF